MRPKVLAICGQTASGKSGLGLKLAQILDGEILCMDSMQIYRKMDIGTAKPTHEEQKIVPHHLLDIVEPDASYVVADYRIQCAAVIHSVSARGKIPILVGGTGLYLRSLLQGFHLGDIEGNTELRSELNAIAATPGGNIILHERLAACDPLSAVKLHPNDLRRVIRAIEVSETTGIPLSQRKNEPEESEFDILPMAIEMPRDELYSRIEIRGNNMMKSGLLNEVRDLLKSGIPHDCQSMQAIGYKEFLPVVLHDTDPAKALEEMIIHTRHYAKRQGTWFRGEPAVRWLSPLHAETEALILADAFLTGKPSPIYS